MVVANDVDDAGNTQIFMNMTRVEVLDITFDSANTVGQIRNWRVLDELFLSLPQLQNTRCG